MLGMPSVQLTPTVDVQGVGAPPRYDFDLEASAATKPAAKQAPSWHGVSVTSLHRSSSVANSQRNAALLSKAPAPDQT